MVARPALEKDPLSPFQVAVQHLLDRVPDAVGKIENEHRVVGCICRVIVHRDGFAELDDPARRQRQ